MFSRFARSLTCNRAGGEAGLLPPLTSPAGAAHGKGAAARLLSPQPGAAAGARRQSPGAGSPGGGDAQEQQQQQQLWVSKYAPRKFMSLLSDELTNR